MRITKSFFLTYCMLCIVFFMQAQSDRLVDSLEKVLSTPLQDTAKISVLKKLSFAIVGANPNKAIEYSLQGIKLSKQYADPVSEAKCYNNLGSAYTEKGEYENAMSAYMKALSIYEQRKDESGTAIVYTNLGFIFRQQKNYTKAISFHRKAFQIHQKLKENGEAAGCMVNIGNVYYNKGDYDSAIVQYKDALDIYQKLNDKESIATIENNIGAIYFDRKEFDKANEYFLRSYVIREQSGNKYEMATSLNNIGEVFGKLHNYDKAIEFCTKSLKIAEEIDAKDIMLYNYENLASLNSFIGKFNEAYHYQVLNSAIKDSILDVENNKQINELSVKYESEKKEAENKVLRAEGERQRTVSIAVTVGLILVGMLAFFMFRSYRQKKKANELLHTQNFEIRSQKSIIEEKSRIVEEKNKDILDSIRYAKRLQEAILPTINFSKEFGEHAFILYKPKDIVSGDFYWMEKRNGKILVAAVDSTGHGVPGAFMSIVGYNLLNQALREHHLLQPSLILDEINKGVTETLRQYEADSSVKDGMDIALCSIDKEKMELEYSGAFNPFWLIRDGKLMEIKGNKFPVGAFIGEEINTFTNHIIRLEKNDMIYLFSDGYADQFGGPDGKKFKYKQLEKLLTTNYSKPAREQKIILQRTFESWIGRLEQVDDVLIIGIKIQ